MVGLSYIVHSAGSGIQSVELGQVAAQLLEVHGRQALAQRQAGGHLRQGVLGSRLGPVQDHRDVFLQLLLHLDGLLQGGFGHFPRQLRAHVVLGVVAPGGFVRGLRLVLGENLNVRGHFYSVHGLLLNAGEGLLVD